MPISHGYSSTTTVLAVTSGELASAATSSEYDTSSYGGVTVTKSNGLCKCARLRSSVGEGEATNEKRETDREKETEREGNEVIVACKKKFGRRYPREFAEGRKGPGGVGRLRGLGTGR